MVALRVLPGVKVLLHSFVLSATISYQVMASPLSSGGVQVTPIRLSPGVRSGAPGALGGPEGGPGGGSAGGPSSSDR